MSHDHTMPPPFNVGRFDDEKAERHRVRREAPKTVEECKERAQHHLTWAVSPNVDHIWGPGTAEKHLAKARRYLEAARLLKELEEL